MLRIGDFNIVEVSPTLGDSTPARRLGVNHTSGNNRANHCRVLATFMMGGTELVYNLFAECRTGSGNTHSGLCVIDPGALTAVWPVARAILVAMVVKGALTIVTFGIKVPAGIFIPTLGVGACAGRVLGIAMQWHQMQSPEGRLYKACGGDLDCIIPGLYAMVGAAATLSGVTVRGLAKPASS